MLPVLVSLPFLKVYTFGIFLFLAFFWSLFWLWKNLKRTSFHEIEIFDSVFVSLVGGFLSARIVHVALHFDKFGFDPLKFLLINGYPGLSLIGFIGGFLLTLLAFTRIAKISFLELTVYMVPSIFLALFIGHIGAFFGGSTVGTTTNFILKVAYVGHVGARHITALYEAIIMIIGFALAQRMVKSYRRDSLHEGSSLSLFMILTGLSMLILDNFKENAVYFWHLPFGVWVAAVVVIVFTLLEGYKYRASIAQSVMRLRVKNQKKKQP